MKKTKWYVIFISFSLITLGAIIFFVFGMINQYWGVATSEWLSAILSWLSVASAIFIGLTAFWQNERFKEENDKASERADQYQEDLIHINNRLIKIEENKECAQLAFMQEIATVSNSESFQPNTNRKKYTAGITDSGRDFNCSTIFSFGITNQTHTPVRCFELTKFKISYCDYEKDDEIPIKSYGKGGFVPSPIIDYGEVVNYILVANNLQNVVESLPKGYEIVIRLTMEVTSIYNRTVEQRFLLRLQKKNVQFNSPHDTHYFWNYCFELDSKIVEYTTGKTDDCENQPAQQLLNDSATGTEVDSVKTTASNKIYKPNTILYLLLLAATVLIILSAILLDGCTMWFTIVSGIGCGGFASVLVAWLIDIATCSRNNKKAENDQQEIFRDLMQTFETSIQIFIFQCQDFDKEPNDKPREQTWHEWIREASKKVQSDDERREIFINAFLTFERSIAEEIRAINLQRTQLLNLGLITNNDSRMISYVGTWCSLVESDYKSMDCPETFCQRVNMLVNLLSAFVEKSDILKHINSEKYKALVE